MLLQNENLLRYLGFNTQGDLGPWTFYTARNKGLVWFVKSPPLQPPTFLQFHQRNLFRAAARVWRGFTPQQRNAWLDAAESAKLSVHGYNIFVYYQVTRDADFIPTLERITGISIPLR